MKRHLKNTMSSLLTNIHEGAEFQFSSGNVYLVSGKYEYYHYLCDGFDDRGWGCGYRTLQTLCSWMNKNFQKNLEIPSIRQVQEILVDLEDKPKSFLGSRQWIGSFEVCLVIDKLYDFPCKILHVNKGDNLSTIVDTLKIHFEKFGSPIMMGGDIDCSSKGIMGIHVDNSEASLLIVGWGCGYRTLQTLCSWMNKNFQKNLEIPSIRQVQEILVDLEDKPKSFLGSRQWIGSFEVCLVIDKLYDFPCKILHVNKGDNLSTIVDTLKIHFEKFGSPIMMGGDIDCSSKGIMGIHVDNSEASLLIVGWGCGYRTLQTLCSWMNKNFQKNLEIPSIRQVQEILVDLEDKPKSFLGSRQWIGSFEVCLVIDKLYDFPCKILHVNKGDNLSTIVDTLKIHFEKFGSPIMMGGDIDCSSKGIMGIHVDNSEASLLIVDPHYVGKEQTSEFLQNKGWVKWQPIRDFLSSSFYNLCLPQAKSKGII